LIAGEREGKQVCRRTDAKDFGVVEDFEQHTSDKQHKMNEAPAAAETATGVRKKHSPRTTAQ